MSRRVVIACGVVVAAAAVVVALALWPRDSGADHPVQERIRGVALVHDEDGAIHGPWTSCGPAASARLAPGTEVEVVDGAGHRLGAGELHNVGPEDMDRLAILVRDHAVEDESMLAGSGPALRAFLEKHAGSFCLLQYAVRVDRASDYTLRFGGENYATYSQEELRAAGWYYGIAVGF